MEKFLRAARFRRVNAYNPIPETVREQFLEQNQEKLGVIYKYLGTLIAASQAMGVSVFAQFAIIAIASYVRYRM